MNNALRFFIVADSAYLASALSFLAWFATSHSQLKWVARRTFELAFLLLTVALCLEGWQLGHLLPLAALHQAVAVFVWATTLIYLVTVSKLKLQSFGIIVAPFLFFLTLVAVLTYRAGVVPTPYLHDRFFVVHTVCAFLAYAGFALAAISGIFYLIQRHELKEHRASTWYHRLPSLEGLEALAYRAMTIGVPLLTVSLVSGLFWSRDVFGVWGKLDVKSILGFITWGVYLTILYIHYARAVRGRRMMVCAALAFSLVLATLLGANVFQSDMHQLLQ